MKTIAKKSAIEKPHRRRAGNRAAALVAWAAISACLALPLNAVVIDDFGGPVKFLPGYFGTNSALPSLSNGRLVFSGQFVEPLNPNNPYANLNNIGWSNCLPVVNLEGRTLEVRMDLVRASADDMFLVLAVENAWPGAGYAVLVDQNEVALSKYGSHVALAFWTNAAVTNQNVSVSLALTRMTNTMLVTTKVLNKGTGQTLFERSFLDGPGSDCAAPTPPPRGMTIFVADPGGPYTNFPVVWAGVWDLRTTAPPPLEVVLDNLEYDLYDVPSLQIAKSVLLSWSENTEEEQVVVMADSLTSTNWTPCPAQIFTGSGGLSIAMPITENQQFFKLVPGRQFVDNFSDSWGPFTNRNSWTSWFQETGEDWVVTNGVLQVSLANQPAYGGMALCPLGATNVEAVLRDFCASVDTLDWITSGTNWSTLGLFGRGRITSPSYGTAYFGGIGLNYSDAPPGHVMPWIAYGSTEIHGLPFDMATTPPPYRIQFSGVGNRMSLRVLSVTTGAVIREMPFTNSAYATGVVGLWFNGRTEAGDSYTNTVDNFFMSGTKP